MAYIHHRVHVQLLYSNQKFALLHSGEIISQHKSFFILEIPKERTVQEDVLKDFYTILINRFLG